MHSAESSVRKSFGWWKPDENQQPVKDDNLIDKLFMIHEPIVRYERNGQFYIGGSGSGVIASAQPSPEHYSIRGFAPPMDLKSFGNGSFCNDHGIEYPVLAGSMANGISSVALVSAMGAGGMLGFLGTAGQGLSDVESQIKELQGADLSFGCNLIHSPNESYLEEGLADLFIRCEMRLVEASAYMDLTLPLIRYRVHGIHRNSDGAIVTPNRIIGKASRVEVARRFYSPPPEKFLRELVSNRVINEEQALLAEQIPVAQDLTAEADSGGHTDNRPMITLFPVIAGIRSEMQRKYNYPVRLHLGAAGGIGSPASAAAVFAMGASYILLGSVMQACVEAGTSPVVREMLAQTKQAEVAMAPAADMFEMGVKVQVLKRGTMFAMKAGKLHDLYKSYAGLDQLPDAERIKLEKTYFRCSIDEIWRQTRAFFLARDPGQVDRADRDPKHKMALVFRWYLGHASVWANHGEPDRRIDYQVWCGPAMGLFNQWVQNSCLDQLENRKAADIALNILMGAAVIQRARMAGVLDRVSGLTDIPPRTRGEIESYILKGSTVEI